MRRRDFMKLASASVGMGASALAAADRTKPDVLLIMTDQFNPRCAGYAGSPTVQTPNLDRLAREGVSFDACYSNSPVCMPARLSLATGRYPHEHGHWMNGGRAEPASIITMFHDIRRAGYTTAKVGKFHYPMPGKHQDFREFAEYYRAIGLDHADELSTPFSTPGRRSAFTDHLVRRGLLDVFLDDIFERYEKGQYLCKPSPVAPKDHNDSFVAQRSLGFLKQHPRDKPFFLFVSFPGPHTPLDACGRYATMYDPAKIVLPPNVKPNKRYGGLDQVRRMRALYYGKITMIDHLIGTLLAELERRGTLDNTLVLFTADHGEMIGAQGKLSKGVFYEESCRVPLLVRWPGRARAGARTQALVELIDVYATIVDAIGGEMAPTSHGRSVLPVASGRSDTHRDVVFGEIGPGNRLDFMVRTPDYKYFIRAEREYLFDMRRDPYEMKDLAKSKDAKTQEVLRSMRRRLKEFVPPSPPNYTSNYKPQFKRLHEVKPNMTLQESLSEKRRKSAKKLRASPYLR